MNRPHRILVVDDAPDTLSLLARGLDKEGYELRLATGGIEARRLVDDGFRPDLVLLDMVMPGMDGAAFCRILKASPATRGIPVLFLSAWDSAEQKLAAFASGGVDYISKPFHMEEVLARVRTHLRLVDHDALVAEIEARRKIEADLRRSQRLAHVGTWSRGREPGSLRWSDEMFSIFDVPRETPVHELHRISRERIHPDDRPLVDEVMRRILDTGRASPVEHRVVHRDGSIRHVWIETSTSRDGCAEEGVWGVVLDTTEQNRIQKRQGELQIQLEKGRKFEALGRFAAGIAHTFNNILEVTQGHSELGMLQSEGFLRERFEGINLVSRRAREFTTQLMGFAQHKPIEPRVVPVAVLVEDLLPLLKVLVGDGCELAWDPCADPLRVRVDVSQIGQILTNLCGNARDATGGGGRIRISSGVATIHEPELHGDGLVPEGEYAVVSVCDDGPGVEGDALEHLFEPFYTTKPKGKGTGLGLATSWGIARQNGGVIRYRSAPQGGACFQLLLPLVDSDAPAAGQRSSGRPSRKARKMLLVDDEELIVDFVKQVVEMEGWTVWATTDPVYALDLAREHAGDVDLVVSDVMMPCLNGFELVERVKELMPDVPHLLMSGYADVALGGRARQDGWNLIAKPFGTDELLPRIAEVVAKSPRAAAPRRKSRPLAETEPERRVAVEE